MRGVDDDGNDGSSDFDHYATPPTSAPQSPTEGRSRAATLSSQTWPVRPGGILDRSGTESSTLHPVVCSRVAAEHRITQVHLNRNLFSTLPEGFSFFAATLTALSLAHNQLVGEAYLCEALELPAEPTCVSAGSTSTFSTFSSVRAIWAITVTRPWPTSAAAV